MKRNKEDRKLQKLIQKDKESIITVFGDSVSKGVYLDDKLSIKKLDNPLVKLLQDECNVNIVNNRVFGQTLARAYEKGIFNKYIENLDKTKNNICVICLGGNDADFDWQEVAINPTFDHGPKTNILVYESILKTIIHDLKANDVKVALFTLFPIHSELYFNNVIAKKYNRCPILRFLKGDLTNLNRHQEIFNNSIIKIAYETNSVLLDIRNIFLDSVNYIDYCSKDGVHPNQEAQYKIFDYLYNLTNTYDHSFKLKYS